VFSQQHADAACNFFENVLKHTADDWFGKPFLLAPWEEEAVSHIFGDLDERGNRLIQLVYLELPKKSGKTEFAAGVLLMLLALESTPGCQVYGAGAALRQAANVYRAACKMVEQTPILKKRFRVLRSTYRIIKRSDPDSFYAAVAADGDLSDGVNPSVTVADEVHRWKTRKQLENWDVLSLGGITRRQTLTIAITTAGVQNESPLAWRLHEKTLRIKQGVISDPTFYGRIYGAEENDDWTDEKVWIKANPSLIENGGFLPLSKIREKYQAALSDPEAQFAFKKYYLNIWGQKENRAIDMVQWDNCGRRSHGDKVQFLPWRAAGLLPQAPGDKIRPLAPEVLQHFAKRRCWAGLDMSMTTDMSALCFIFPCEDGGYEILPFIWLPEKDIKKREITDGMPYRTWGQQGFLELSDSYGGSFIDQAEIEARILWASQNFDLREVCYDPWNAHAMIGRLIDAGIECVEIRQGYATLTAPSKKLLELVIAGKLYHGGHPVLKWNASCLSTRERNDNLMFSKPERNKSSLRIDGISATVNALQRAMLDMNHVSVYETRGILSL
jgi:phage terminase large subunit-like protein